MRGLLLGVFGAACLFSVCDAFWDDSGSFMKTFRDGMKELQEASRKMDEMMAAESRIEGEQEDRSREELEDKDDTQDGKDIDEVTSKEGGKGRRPAKEDDSEEDPEDIDDMLNPVMKEFPGIFNIFRIGTAIPSKPWYSGPNVCVTRDHKEDNETKEGSMENPGDNVFVIGSAHFSSCKHTARKYTCTTLYRNNGETTTTIVTYECCHGYARPPGGDKCEKFETKPITEVAVELGANKFVSLAESSGLKDNLVADNRTVFLPTDEAFEKFQTGMADVNQIDTQGNTKAIETNDVMDMAQPSPSESGAKTSASNQDLVLNHIVPSMEDTSDFRNDLMLKSESHGTLRVNYFPGQRNPVLTVNCVRINSTDQVTDTGIVHTIEGVLTPVVKSVQEILEQPNYSKFKALLEEQDLWKELSDKGPYTVLAVGDNAFDSLKLEAKPCIKRVLKHHILPHTVCSGAASSGHISAMDLSSNWVSLRFDGDNEEAIGDSTGKTLIFDSNVEAVKTDLMATNGLVHEVNGFIVPNSAKSVAQMLRATNATRMIAYLEKAGLMETADTSNNLTFFVPTEEALARSGQDLDQLSPEELKDVLAYHMATAKNEQEADNYGSGEECHSHDLDHSGYESDVELPTKNNKKITVRPAKNILSSFIGLPGKATVQCVPLVRFNGKVCNGVMHEIAAVLKPPSSSLLDIIESDERLERFREVLKGTKLEVELKSPKTPLTVLAPDDEAFDKIGKSNWEVLTKDKDLADQVLRSHILSDAVCCSSIGKTSWPFTQSVRTIAGSRLEFNGGQRYHHHSNNDDDDAAALVAVFGPARTRQCDLVATDGIVHVIDKVMLPANLRKVDTDVIIRRPFSEIILAGL